MDRVVEMRGRRVLVVEDEYPLAMEMRRELERAGAQVVGPVGTLQDAMIAASKDIEGAILDIRLGDDTVYPAADILKLRGIPFVFSTGYEMQGLPSRYADVPVYAKPIDAGLMLDLLTARAPPALPRVEELPSSDVAARLIAAAGTTVHAAEGDVILEPGAPSGDAVLVRSGAGSVTVANGGRYTSVALTTPTMLVGADRLVFGRPSPFGCVMRVGGEVQRIDGEVLSKLCATDPDVRALVLASTAGIMQDMAANLRWSTLPVVVRLARLLVQTFELCGEQDVRLTHKTLSSILSVRRASVTVALHALEGERAIRSLRGRVLCRDMQVLRRWARWDGESPVA